MKLSARHRYIFLAVLAYLVLALAWIFLSDRLLAAFADPESLVRLSTAKGIFFVLASGACFAVALRGVPGATEPTAERLEESLLDALTIPAWPRWSMYLLAVTLTLAALVVRNLMPVGFGDRPILILFMLPITLAALLGGFGPGLTATLTGAGLTMFFLIPPVKSLTVAASHDLFQLALLVFNGLVISLISATLHRSRHRERHRRLQVESVNAALRQSEEQFRRLFDEAPVAMTLADHEGCILAQNERMTRLFGFSRDEVPTVADWWPRAYPDPDDRARARQQWEATLARMMATTEAVDAGEYRVTCKDGSERIVHLYSLVLAEGLLTAFLDETERHRAETMLRLWAESFERAELGLVLTDARRNTILSANPAFARTRGYDREEMVGMAIGRLFPEDRLPDLHALVATLATKPHTLFETEHITKDGKRFPVLLDLTVITDQDGQPSHRIAYALDITERKRVEQALAEALEEQKRGRIAALNQMEDANAARRSAEQALAALRESEERLALFIEHAPAALAMFDRDMRYLAASRRWQSDYSLDNRDLIGRCHYDVFPEIGEDLQSVHRRGMAGEVIGCDEDPFVRGDGRVQWLRWEMRPWHDAGGGVGGILIFSEDITRFKEAQEEIRRLNVDLERRVVERTAELTAANRELDSFAYAVSHDLRAPLRAMSGFARALVEDYGEQLDGEAGLYLDQIEHASKKMGALIDGLLALSRSIRGVLHREPVDLSRLAEQMLAEMAGNEPDRQVRWQIEPNLIAHGDRVMLTAVLDNLLANAWKFTAHRREATIRVFAEEDAGQHRICIADNGAGFDPAHADKLFQPFQRLHRQDEFPGIGIGLATAQRIIHRHGGTLTASGAPDKGATFCIGLPTDDHSRRGDEP